jgi:hypothetical protein
MATYGNDSLGFDPIPVAITGLTWQAQLASKIFDETGDKAVKSFWGEHYWNVNLINKLNELYVKPLLPGADKVLSMSASASVSKEIVQAFIKNIEQFRGIEKTPSLIKTVGDVTQKIAEGIGNTAEGAGEGAKKIPTVLIILSLGIAGYLIYAGKKGTKLTPF